MYKVQVTICSDEAFTVLPQITIKQNPSGTVIFLLALIKQLAASDRCILIMYLKVKTCTIDEESHTYVVVVLVADK